MLSEIFSVTMISVTGIFTFTETVAFTVGLSFEVTVMIVSPSPTAMIFPFASTVTTDSSADSYIRVLFVASAGVTVAVIFAESSLLRVISVLSTVIDVTGTFTVTDIVSLFDGSSFELTVIVAVPTPTAVTLPSSSTFTTFSSDDLYSISLTVASSGLTVTLICDSPFLSRTISPPLISTLSTGFLK